ncbi:MAG: ATP-binding protein, partial [Gemmataceae bacterium]
MEEETESKAQSPELAAGAGFTFEDAVGAYFLSALLDEGYAAGIENRIVVRVALQQRNFKQPLDDVIVDFRDQHGGLARMSLQVKRELTVSDAETNEGFRDVVRDCWRTYKKDDFRKNLDRYGAAVGEIAKDKARDLIFLCEMARESTTTSHFIERFATGGNASGSVKTIKFDIETLLTAVEGRRPSDLELHQFLAHFVLEKFDFLHGGAVDPPEIITRVRTSLAIEAGNQAPQLWAALRQTVRDSAGKSGEFDRPRLVRTLVPVFRLRAAPSLWSDLEQITNLTRMWLADITNDVGGTHLDRIELSRKLTDLLSGSRFVQIMGLPGSGKSVVLRQRLEADVGRGPVLFMKSDRLSGTGWSSFAASNGLSSAPLIDLLVEIGATGSNTLFIDGIDRVEKERRPLVLDVLRTVLGSQLLSDWKIIVSLRDTGIEPLRNWVGDVLGTLSVATLDVGALDDGEAEELAQAKPHLRGLLFGAPSVREIVRRPFFAKILDQTGSADFQPQSEVDLLENWWARGGYNADGQEALDRQRALIDIGGAQARHLSDPIRFSELSPSTSAQIERLAADGLVRHVKQGHTVRFAHDILFEWSFFHALSDTGENWLGEIRSCGEPPAVARAVELLSQYEYREGKTWAKTLRQVTQSQMRSQWTRAWLLGPIAASSFSTNEGRFLEAVFADNFHFLRRALVWLQAERTTPNPTILKGELPQEQRIRIADLLGWPSDFGNWRRFLLFLLPRTETISAALYPDVVSVFEVWQNALSGLENSISSAIVARCAAWLREIDKRETRPTADQESRWDGIDGLGDFRKSLINIILRSAGTVPKATEEYLKRLVGNERLRDEGFAEIVPFCPILARTHPELLVGLTLKHLKEELPDDKVERDRKELEEAARRRDEARAKPESERTERDTAILEGGGVPHFGLQFSYYDWNRVSIDHDTHNFWPASPLREPFHSLFKSAPEYAIKLFDDLCNHAITAWRQLHRHIRESPRPGTPLPLVLKFPWGTQEFWGGDREYLWYRGLHAPEALESGFRALEDWCFSELERGRPVDELIRQIVEGN